MPSTSATVPLDTPGTSSTDPIASPRSTWPPVRRARSAGVTPGHPLTQRRQVVVRAARGDGEERDALGDQRLALLARVAAHTHGPLDLGRVASDVRAVSGEHLVLAAEGLDVRPRVPDVAVLGDVAQRLALPAPADEHRDVPGGRRVEGRPPAADAGQRLRQVTQAGAGGAELVPVLAVVALVPACADAEDQSSAADVVDRAGHVGEQVGVAVAVAGDQRADLHPAGLLGPGAEHGPALEVLAVGVAAEREEVVPVEDDVGAGVLGAGNGVADLVVVGVLGLELDGDPHLSGHGPHRAKRSGSLTGPHATSPASRGAPHADRSVPERPSPAPDVACPVDGVRAPGGRWGSHAAGGWPQVGSSSGLVSRAWVAALACSGSALAPRDIRVLRTVEPTTASSLPASIAATPSRATWAGSSLLSLRPTRVSSIPARSKNSVSVGPGIIVVTVTPVSFSSYRTDWAKFSANALDALYVA